MAREISIVKGERINIKYENNTVFDLIIRVTKNSGVAYTLTAKTLHMDVKKNREDASYVYRLTQADGITISDTNLLTFSKVMSLPSDTYYYDLKITTDNYIIMGGLIKVERDVSS